MKSPIFSGLNTNANERTRHSALPFTSSRGRTGVHTRPARLLGVHNHEILSGLGLTDEQVAELEADGVIRRAPAMHRAEQVKGVSGQGSPAS